MTERILTLCESCKSDLEIGGFRVKPVTGTTTTEKKPACENCGQKIGAKQYLVSVKRR